MGKTRQSANLVSDGNIFVDIVNDRVGVGSLSPKVKLDVVGVVSATSFTGNITGTASTASFATTSFGLFGTPNLNVGVVTASSFVGNVTGTAAGLSGTPNLNVGVVTASSFVGNVAGTAAGLSGTPNLNVGFTTVNNNLTVVGVSTANQSRFLSVAERLVRVDGNTVSIAYTSTGANIGFCTNATGNITLAVTGIPTDSSFDNHAISFSVFIQQTGTARSCTAVTLNGVTETIRWAGGSLASAISGVTTTNGYDIYNFVGINTIGSASTAANYEVLGVVNGGFR